ncbi:uncharacterized protein LOC114933427 [Nylanderia fulva]|uniref:uncharacterized protein LOC114933427 n=1 Tax=Nylanderia fulva TaxID=613905 RepID=UPI0010FB2F67|nr:uncharacterized protein LOC114933427 [Nylanderia fulva]
MKKADELVNSSSSEDEISASVLQEAIDQQFLKNTFYKTGETKVAPESDSEINKPKSLRISKQDKFTNFGVTDTFQNFVANKLDGILERTIKLKRNKTTECFIKQKRKRNKNSGIKLLSTSKKFVTTKEITKLFTKHKEKLGRCSPMEDDDTLLKFQEAAVSPESILNPSDTIVYNDKYSEPEFKYKKLKDGVLIEV